VGIADTRVLSGSEVILARKVSVYQQEGQAMFLMTSGLRSLRDKAVTYFEDAVAQQPEPFACSRR
jgi:putative proteasome-type protease